MLSNSFISFIMAVMLMVSPAQIGTQMSLAEENYNNYTADYNLCVSFDSSKEIVSLLEETGALEEIEKHIDMEPFLKSLLSYNEKALIEADISDDLKVAKVGITTQSEHGVDVNKNLGISLKVSTGIWMVIDMRDIENPVLDVVYSNPSLNKYVRLNVFEYVSEDEKNQITDALQMFTDKERADKIKSDIAGIIKKYAKVKVKVSSCEIIIDNDAFIDILEDLKGYIFSEAKPYIAEEDVKEIEDYIEGISFEELQLLGDKGIVYTYNYRNKKISSINSSLDVCVDVSKIYTAFSGEEWNFISNGKIKFTLSATTVLSKIGSTQVQFPRLTDKNSLYFEELYPYYGGYYDYEYNEEEPLYPNWYVGGEAVALPVINGTIYVPLRSVLENAYEDSVDIKFEEGTITATCEYFPEFRTLSLTVGDTGVYTDGERNEIGIIYIENQTTYVSSDLFVNVFGWEFSDATHYMLDDCYSYSFITSAF